MTRKQIKLDNPLIVEWEYASEERLRTRNEIYRSILEGENAEDVAFAAVAEVSPRRVLDVGSGTGEFAERASRELEAEVVAVDVSPRMVELTRARGVDARVADAEQLPFPDAEFDCVAANWVLYHVRDVGRAAAEMARVLRPGGRLVAATVGRNLPELWALVGAEPELPLSFNPQNGAELLAQHFGRVERRDVRATVVFADTATMRTFVAATITRSYLSGKVPELREPFRATSEHAVFVAEKPA